MGRGRTHLNLYEKAGPDVDRTHQPQAEPTPAPDDGTPTNDPAAALHWAAAATGLAEAREQQGHYLTPDEQAAFTRYQSAARSHGFTDEQIRCYANTLSNPAVNQ